MCAGWWSECGGGVAVLAGRGEEESSVHLQATVFMLCSLLTDSLLPSGESTVRRAALPSLLESTHTADSQMIRRTQTKP